MLNQTDLSRVDLNLLVLFEAVLEEGHVGRAAARLNLSASAVSHGLSRLRALLNDPLFLKHPKGVVATARAQDLAAPVGDILARVRAVVAQAERFDPARSTRRFTLGAPDGASAVILPPLLAHIGHAAPGVDLSVRALMPQDACADLDARSVDIAIAPLVDIPARFAAAPLYDEEFVIAMRQGHPLGAQPTLAAYAAAAHVLVSLSGDPHGNVDDDLKAHGLARRVAVTAPSFLSALAIVGATDLVAAIPKRHAEMFAARFGVAIAPAPIPVGRTPLQVIAPHVALRDAGVAWLFAAVAVAARPAATP